LETVAVPSSSDPYTTLGVGPGASDAELRAAYRRLVQLHHPDHNGGSPESARRFEEVQEAYAHVRELRRRGDAAGAPRPGAARSTGQRRDPSSSGRPGGASPPPRADPDLESRLAEMERDLRAARAARDQALREAREAARQAAQSGGEARPSDEELGYVTTDDSFSKILADAAAGLSEHLADARLEHLADARLEHLADAVREKPVTKRVADLIDELGARLTGEHHKP
jgi:curved DNA-binding protein CbpA